MVSLPFWCAQKILKRAVRLRSTSNGGLTMLQCICAHLTALTPASYCPTFASRGSFHRFPFHKSPGDSRLAETGQSPSTVNESHDLEIAAWPDPSDAWHAQVGDADVGHHRLRDV